MSTLFLLSSMFCWTETCYLRGQEVSGFHKLCYYKCLFGTTVREIASYELCPLVVQREN